MGDIGLDAAALAALDATVIDGTTGLGAPLAASRLVRVGVDAANLREGPGTSYRSLGKLDTRNSVTLLAYSGEWFNVRTSSNTTGWMSSEVLSLNTAATRGLPEANAISAKPATTQAVTNSSRVNLRSGPGTNYRSLGKLSQGLAVTLLDSNGAWRKVETPKGSIGWVKAQYLTTGKMPETSAKVVSPLVGYTASTGVRLRRGPGAGFAVIRKFNEDTAMTLVARYGDWYKVKTPNGTLGWISGDVLNITSSIISRVPTTKDVPAAPAKAVVPNDSGMGTRASRLAMRLIGKPYVWGAAGPRAFDCSGVLVYVYKQLGVYLPHKASMQFSSRYGTIIRSMGSLKPGDMVFFKNTAGRGITHAALYVGNGMIVTANTPRTGVRYQTLNTRYWRAHWAGAVRPYKK